MDSSVIISLFHFENDDYSYVKLNELVDQIFPPLKYPNRANEPMIHAQYSDLNFWRTDIPELDIDEISEDDNLEDEDGPEYSDEMSDYSDEDSEDVNAPLPFSANSIATARTDSNLQSRNSLALTNSKDTLDIPSESTDDATRGTRAHSVDHVGRHDSRRDRPPSIRGTGHSDVPSFL